jgi:hypothetical protein
VSAPFKLGAKSALQNLEIIMTTKLIVALALMASALGGCSTMDRQGDPGGSSSYGNTPNAAGSYYPNTGGGN